MKTYHGTLEDLAGLPVKIEKRAIFAPLYKSRYHYDEKIVRCDYSNAGEIFSCCQFRAVISLLQKGEIPASFHINDCDRKIYWRDEWCEDLLIRIFLDLNSGERILLCEESNNREKMAVLPQEDRYFRYQLRRIPYEKPHDENHKPARNH